MRPQSVEADVSSGAAHEILVRAARALAHGDDLGQSLEALLEVIPEQLAIESAVIVLVDGGPDHLAIVASAGLGEAARAGLANAIANPAHPIVRTLADPVSTFDVLPMNPGGPALRSHLPLTIRRSGGDAVLGVLALAHEGSTGAEERQLIQAAADLAAVAVERSGLVRAGLPGA
jgi:GAF domain-containing protein